MIGLWSFFWMDPEKGRDLDFGLENVDVLDGRMM